MSKPTDKNRRDFLKLAATTAPVAALAVTADTAEATAPKLSERGDACMQDSAHIRRYYELARF